MQQFRKVLCVVSFIYMACHLRSSLQPRHCRFDVFDLLKFIDHIPDYLLGLPRALLPFFMTTFLKTAAYALFTKHEDKVTRCWPSSFSVSYPVILTQQAWSIKHLLYGQKKILLVATQQTIKMELSCPLEKPFRAQNLLYLANACRASHIIKV